MTVIFLHIPKASGTTFHSVLDRMYDKSELFDIRVVNKKLTTQSFIDLPLEDKKKIKMLKGHLHYGIHKHFDASEDIKYITLLRSPESRIVSHYYYVLSHPGHYLFNQVVGKKMTLLDYALSDLSSELDNGQTRLISGLEEVEINKCNRDMLNTSIDNLQSNFLSFGITEKFDESLVLFQNKLGWTGVPCFKIMNDSKKKRIIPPDVINKIRKRNHLDIELYNWALSQFDRQLDALPNLDGELNRLRMANISYGLGYEEGYGTGFNAGCEKTSQKYKLIRPLVNIIKAVRR